MAFDPVRCAWARGLRSLNVATKRIKEQLHHVALAMMRRRRVRKDEQLHATEFNLGRVLIPEQRAFNLIARFLAERAGAESFFLNGVGSRLDTARAAT